MQYRKRIRFLHGLSAEQQLFCLTKLQSQNLCALMGVKVW
jgi:hypothetical protein